VGNVEEQRHGYRRILPYNPILKERAKKLRKNMTLSEVLLWKHLKRKQIHGFDFDRQRPIDQFVVDFYCKDLMLAIEIDGSSHDGEKAQAKDKVRQKRLESFGVRFLRFGDIEVKRNIDGVVKTIAGWVLQHKDDLVGRYGDEDLPERSSTSETPASYEVPGTELQPAGDRKGGRG
jgi:very-short-patch-repair endonuclease